MQLAESFVDYFTVELAVTPEQLHDVYTVRYHVYCEEFGFEEAENFPDKMEYDEFDEHSLHCLIRHKNSGLPAACVRLVLPEKAGFASLPLSRFCSHSLDSNIIQTLDTRSDKICELSRLAVDGAFRRRPAEKLSEVGDNRNFDVSDLERRSFSLITVAGFLSITAMTDITGRNNVFAMMKPFLPKMVGRSGIKFTKVGHEVDYHGLRAPYFCTTQTAISGMSPALEPLYQVIHDELSAQFSVPDASGLKVSAVN